MQQSPVDKSVENTPALSTDIKKRAQGSFLLEASPNYMLILPSTSATLRRASAKLARELSST